MKQRPRPIARLRAWFGGYFWLPCPHCGRMFGGYEMTGRLREPGARRGIWEGTCKRCPGIYGLEAP